MRLTRRSISFIWLVGIILSACTGSALKPEAALSGHWAFAGGEGGNLAYASDLHFQEDGVLTFLGRPQDAVTYVVIAPGRLKLTVGGSSEVLNYRLEEDTLTLFIGDGHNMYTRAPETQPISQGEPMEQPPTESVPVSTPTQQGFVESVIEEIFGGSTTVDDQDAFEQGAIIESIELSQSFALQKSVNVSGYLTDECTELKEITVERLDQEFKLNLGTLRKNDDAVCTMSLVPFDILVDLEFDPLETGIFTILAQEQQVQFFVFAIDSANPEAAIDKTITEVDEILWDIHMVFEFDYLFDIFPNDISVVLTGTYAEKTPFVTLTWYFPDGERIIVADVTAGRRETVRFDLQDRLARRLGGVRPTVGLLSIPESDPPEVQQGKYELHVDTIVFEEGSDIEVELIIFGLIPGGTNQ